MSVVVACREEDPTQQHAATSTVLHRNVASPLHVSPMLMDMDRNAGPGSWMPYVLSSAQQKVSPCTREFKDGRHCSA